MMEVFLTFVSTETGPQSELLVHLKVEAETVEEANRKITEAVAADPQFLQKHILRQRKLETQEGEEGNEH